MVTDAPVKFAHARYRAGPELGRGAQGVVLQVQDREDPTRRLVAKLYRPGFVGEGALRAEFALLARMQLPGLVHAHDLGHNELDAAPFLVEDRIEGPDAVEWVQAARETRLERLLRVLGASARTLAALHEAGFLHGDLKPAHVRIAGDLPVLLDLGATTQAVADARVRGFTRSYAAPELLAGGRADARSDLYALGGLAWSAAVGCVLPKQPEPLRARAPWVPPSVADSIDALLAEHPEDRIPTALALLARLGQSTLAAGSLPRPIGRSSELQELIETPAARVRYLVGEAGSGKSHLLRELRVAALLAGRQARLLVPRQDSASQVARWVDVLRGQAPGLNSAELWLIDAVDEAPSELRSAIENYRVIAPADATLQVIAATRALPHGAAGVALGALRSCDMLELAKALGVPEPARERLVLSAAGSPGWLVAALGRVPIAPEAVLAHTRDMPAEARVLLASLAAIGGSAHQAWLRAGALDEARACETLIQAGLLRRRIAEAELWYELEVPALCAELTRTLATPELVVRMSQILLAARDVPARTLLALAGVADGADRRALATRAAAAARDAGARDLEIDALLALGAEPAQRDFGLLARLERLLRDAGRHSEHARVVAWLEAAAGTDDPIQALSLRRSAEQRARAGDKAQALQLADAALELARARNDQLLIAQALATRGAVQLFSSDHAAAARDLDDARERFMTLANVEDREELARLDHNLGVVALYRGQLERAQDCFRAALHAKRALGDSAGMRACLRNLGFTALRAEQYAQAERWLEQALALARSLRQAAGEAWSLVTLAEVEVRRGRTEQAERHLAEIEAMGGEVPLAVRADVALVRAELALAARDEAAFEAALAGLDPETCAADAQVDTSRLLLLARACQAQSSDPAQLRAAARASIRALRRARGAELVLSERAAERALGSALQARRERSGVRATGAISAADRRLIVALGELPQAEVLSAFARHALTELAAERVFVVRFEGERLSEVMGFDMDGLSLAEPQRRVDEAAARAALAGARAVAGSDMDGSRLAEPRRFVDETAARAALAGARAIVGSDMDGPGLVERRRFVDETAARAALAPSARNAVDGPSLAQPRHRVDEAAGRGALAPGAGSPARVACVSRTVAWGTARTRVRWVALAEHRFRPDAFRKLTGQRIRELDALLTLAARIAGASAVPAALGPQLVAADPRASSEAQPASSTALPTREPRHVFPSIVGSSRALRAALARLDAALDSNLPLLLTGETGVGKELFARAVAELGPRRGRPFVAVNCAAIAGSLFEAEFFGHERGAFTGADRRRTGVFVQADGGVLLLDEIGELTLAQQVALLRALETQRVRPLGAEVEHKFDVRLVAATNRDLERAVAEGTFRRDLLYRINVLEVRIPALRERPEDIEPLALHFLRSHGSTHEIAAPALAALCAYAWPGNVRELAHTIQRLSALHETRIELSHLPRALRSRGRRLPAPAPQIADPRTEVLQTLERTSGNITHAARVLGLTRHGLKKRMLRLGLRGPSRGEPS